MDNPAFESKNIPVKDIIQDVINGKLAVLANYENKYVKAVSAFLKGAACKRTHGKSYYNIN